MVYSGDDDTNEGNGDGGVGSGDCCLESTGHVLDLLPNLYFKLNIFPL